MLLLLESCAHQLNADRITKWNQLAAGSGTFVINATGGPRTNPCFQLTTSSTDTSGSGQLRIIPATPVPSGNTFVFGAHVMVNHGFNYFSSGTSGSGDNISGNSSPSVLVSCRKSGSTLWWCRIAPTGKLEVYRGTTQIAQSTLALVQSVWSYFEIKVVLHGSTGTIDMVIDGFSAGSFTGLNTTNSGAVTWDEMQLGSLVGQNGVGAISVFVGDLYLADGSGSDGWNTFKGAMRIDARTGTANGATVTCTPSAGSNFQNIDETSANGDTDYNTATAVGNKDTFTTQDAPVAGATILGVQVVVQAKKTDAGLAGHKAVMRSGGSDYEGTEYGVTTAYSFIRQPWGISPASGIAFTEAEFNAAEFGYTKTT